MRTGRWRHCLELCRDIALLRTYPWTPPLAAACRVRELLLGGMTIRTEQNGAVVAVTTVQMDGDVITIWSKEFLGDAAAANRDEVAETHFRQIADAFLELRRGIALLDLASMGLAGSAGVSWAYLVYTSGFAALLPGTAWHAIPYALVGIRFATPAMFKVVVRQSARALSGKSIAGDHRWYVSHPWPRALATSPPAVPDRPEMDDAGPPLLGTA